LYCLSCLERFRLVCIIQFNKVLLNLMFYNTSSITLSKLCSFNLLGFPHFYFNFQKKLPKSLNPVICCNKCFHVWYLFICVLPFIIPKCYFPFMHLIIFQQYMYLIVFLTAEGAYSLFYTSLYTSQFSNFRWKSH